MSYHEKVKFKSQMRMKDGKNNSNAFFIEDSANCLLKKEEMKKDKREGHFCLISLGTHWYILRMIFSRFPVLTIRGELQLLLIQRLSGSATGFKTKLQS